MKKIGYVLAAIVLTIFGYFLIKTQFQNIKENKFISDIKAGRKSYYEENWMSPLSVRENDRSGR